MSAENGLSEIHSAVAAAAIEKNSENNSKIKRKNDDVPYVVSEQEQMTMVLEEEFYGVEKSREISVEKHGFKNKIFSDKELQKQMYGIVRKRITKKEACDKLGIGEKTVLRYFYGLGAAMNFSQSESSIRNIQNYYQGNSADTPEEKQKKENDVFEAISNFKSPLRGRRPIKPDKKSKKYEKDMRKLMLQLVSKNKKKNDIHNYIDMGQRTMLRYFHIIGNSLGLPKKDSSLRALQAMYKGEGRTEEEVQRNRSRITKAINNFNCPVVGRRSESAS